MGFSFSVQLILLLLKTGTETETEELYSFLIRYLPFFFYGALWVIIISCSFPPPPSSLDRLARIFATLNRIGMYYHSCSSLFWFCTSSFCCCCFSPFCAEMFILVLSAAESLLCVLYLGRNVSLCFML